MPVSVRGMPTMPAEHVLGGQPCAECCLHITALNSYKSPRGFGSCVCTEPNRAAVPRLLLPLLKKDLSDPCSLPALRPALPAALEAEGECWGEPEENLEDR